MREQEKAIYFDLDGTLYNLYNQPNWLEQVTQENEQVFCDGGALYDLQELQELLDRLRKKGYVIGVITWLPKDATRDYRKKVRDVKRQWIDNNLRNVDEVHIVKYGTPKHLVRNVENSILVDDDEQVRKQWQGMTIDATKNIIQQITELLLK